MWKWFGWMCKAAAAALLASFLAVWTTGYIVNSYVEALLEEYEIPLEKPPFALSGLWGRLWGADAQQNADTKESGYGLAADLEPIGGLPDGRSRSGEGAGPTDSIGGTSDVRGNQGREGGGSLSRDGGDPGRSGSESGGDSSRQGMTDRAAGGRTPEGGSGSGQSEPADNGGNSPEDASVRPPEGGESSGIREEIGFGAGPEAHGGAGMNGGGTVVSAGELAEAKSRLTEDERNRLFAILVGKVPQEEWQRISEFTEGGLTEDELLQVQQIVATYLDRAEYDELMGILGKF